MLGTSKGGEAALLLGALHPEIDAVVAVSAPHVVWAGLSQERPQRSSWTRGGEPLPFVPYDDDWEPDTEPVEFVGMYEQSLETYADRVPAARSRSNGSKARCCWSRAATTGSGRPVTSPSGWSTGAAAPASAPSWSATRAPGTGWCCRASDLPRLAPRARWHARGGRGAGRAGVAAPGGAVGLGPVEVTG